jgi:Secretion system C-terminal sorting domain
LYDFDAKRQRVRIKGNFLKCQSRIRNNGDIDSKYLYRTQPQLNDSINIVGTSALSCVDYVKVDSIYTLKINNETFRVARMKRVLIGTYLGNFNYPTLFIESIGPISSHLTWQYSQCGPADFPIYTCYSYNFGNFNYPLNDACKLTSPSNDLKNITFSISPNPSNTFLVLKLPENIVVSEVSITNIIGQKIISNKVLNGTDNHQLDVSKIPDGTYFVSLYIDNQRIIKKIVIQH